MAYSFSKDLHRELDYCDSFDEARAHAVALLSLSLKCCPLSLQAQRPIRSVDATGQAEQESDGSDHSPPERLVAMAIPSAAQHLARSASPFQRNPPEYASVNA
jgi:hypothetical protein